jgi:hypothetical protein
VLRVGVVPQSRGGGVPSVLVWIVSLGCSR